MIVSSVLWNVWTQWLYAGLSYCRFWFIVELADNHLACDQDVKRHLLNRRSKRQEENVLRYHQRAVLWACGLLLNVTKGPANRACRSLSACLGRGAKLDWPNSSPYWSPRNFPRGLCSIGCRDVASPAPAVLHGSVLVGTTVDLYCCVSPFFFTFLRTELL